MRNTLAPFSSDECGEESDEDVITDYLVGGDMEPPPSHPSPLVPIISVTPHSPAGKNYPVLEDNLQQLHEIQESIQQMRDVTAQALSTQILRISEQYARLSASCPSLNAPGSDPDLVTSVNTSPSHARPNTHASLIAPGLSHLLTHKRGSADFQLRGALEVESARRRSWAALEDLTNGKDMRKPTDRQRSSWCSSISLSSLESENDDPFSSSTANLLGGAPKERRGSARSGRTGRPQAPHPPTPSTRRICRMTSTKCWRSERRSRGCWQPDCRYRSPSPPRVYWLHNNSSLADPCSTTPQRPYPLAVRAEQRARRKRKCWQHCSSRPNTPTSCTNC